MINKETKSSDEYKLNKSTKLIVKNVRIDSEDGSDFYRTDITLKYKTGGTSPVVFSDADEISDYLNNIDLDNEQTSLFNHTRRGKAG